MMVYAVMGGFYEAYGLEGVFSTRAKAEEYIAAEMPKYKGLSAGNPDYYDIIEETVDSPS